MSMNMNLPNHKPNKRFKLKVGLVAALALALLVTGCAKTATPATKPNSVKLGYFPNVTHAPAMAGLEKGFFQNELGNDLKLETKVFPNGALFMDALTTGQVDIGFVGPEPAINRYLQGGDVVVISGVSTGGNVVVARGDSGVESIKDLDGKTVATPARGCTHDIELRILMQEQGLKSQDQGGSVKGVVQTPADMMTLLQQKQIDAVAVSEPWASQMEETLGAKVIVEWDQMPWNGKLPGTLLVTTKKFLTENPEIVKKVIKGNLDAINYINANQADSIKLIQDHLAKITKKELSTAILEKSFARTKMTPQFEAQTLSEMMNSSKDFGLVKDKSDLSGLVDLTLLNEVLAGK